MVWGSIMGWVGLAAGVLGVLLVAPFVSASSRPAHPYRYSIVDVPVSLAVGTVRTPEFSPHKTSWHWIMVQVEKPLPPQQMRCMMGVTLGPLDSKNCTSEDPLLRVDWTVWGEGQIISSGSSTTKGDGAFTDQNIFKFLGKFPAEVGKKYILEAKFTKDGTSLNIANPHLIVVKIGEE